MAKKKASAKYSGPGAMAPSKGQHAIINKAIKKSETFVVDSKGVAEKPKFKPPKRELAIDARREDLEKGTTPKLKGYRATAGAGGAPDLTGSRAKAGKSAYVRRKVAREGTRSTLETMPGRPAKPWTSMSSGKKNVRGTMSPANVEINESLNDQEGIKEQLSSPTPSFTTDRSGEPISSRLDRLSKHTGNFVRRMSAGQRGKDTEAARHSAHAILKTLNSNERSKLGKLEVPCSTPHCSRTVNIKQEDLENNTASCNTQGGTCKVPGAFTPTPWYQMGRAAPKPLGSEMLKTKDEGGTAERHW